MTAVKRDLGKIMPEQMSRWKAQIAPQDFLDAPAMERDVVSQMQVPGYSSADDSKLPRRPIYRD